MISTVIELPVDIEVVHYEPAQRGGLEVEPLDASIEVKVMVGSIDVTDALTDEQYSECEEAAWAAIREDY